MSWQKCPICDGTGNQPKHAHVLRRQSLVRVVNGIEQCESCAGKRIIHAETGLPPGYTPQLSLSCSRPKGKLKFKGVISE